MDSDPTPGPSPLRREGRGDPTPGTSTLHREGSDDPTSGAAPLRPLPVIHHCLLPTVYCLLLLLGLGLRLVDLTEPPLDEHPTRQLRSAILARAFYYAARPDLPADLRQAAQEVTGPLEILEPPLFERLVAATYLLAGSEQLWFARLYAIAFWMVAAVFLYDLARRLAGPWPALAAPGLFLLTPFAAYTSRSFQPDAPMVSLLVIAVWALYRWAERPGWRGAVLAGVLAGITILVKVTAALPFGLAAAAFLLARFGLRVALRQGQLWLVAALALAIPAAYYLLQIGAASAGHVGFWTLAYSELLTSPRFYVLWLKFLHYLFDLPLLVLALAGLAFLPRNDQRWLILGWWGGYVVYGLMFPYQIHTHEYYSLMLVPAAGLALAALAQPLYQAWQTQGRFWQLFALAVLALAVFNPAWVIYTGLRGVDVRPEARLWENIGAALPRDGRSVALTDDYGTRIFYYGLQLVEVWPLTVDFAAAEARGSALPDAMTLFAQKSADKDYFIVTALSELERQPELKALLQAYPLIAEGDGYLIYDLRP